MTDNTASLPPAPSQKRAVPAAVWWVLKIAVSGGLMYWLLAKVDLGEVWTTASTASFSWFGAGLLVWVASVLVSAWRWRLLLGAQHVHVTFTSLTGSFLVASFFNNFLPSNIGGDVIRIRDTVKPAGSKTLAATVVLVDRGIGLLALVFVAALGTSLAARKSEAFGPVGPGILWGLLAIAILAAAPAVLRPQMVGTVLKPLRRLHQEWFEKLIAKLTGALAKFRQAPLTLAGGFVGAIVVQALLVAFFATVARGLHIPIDFTHLAILIPLSFIVQMAPVSVNGLGVREATYVTYFAAIGLPRESAVALSLVGMVLIMLFSTSGAVVYVARKT